MSPIAASVAALTILVIACDLIFLFAALNLDSVLRLGPFLARSLLILAAAAAWIPLMISLTALARRPIVAVPLAFVLLSLTNANRFRLDIPAEPNNARLSSGDPWAFADHRAWSESIPFASISSAMAIAAAGIFAALFLIRRRDV